MNPKQKKYSIISTILATLALIIPICDVIFMLTAFDINTAPDPTAEFGGYEMLGALIVAGASAVIGLFVVVFSFIVSGIFSYAAYQCSLKAIAAADDKKSKMLPKTLRTISSVELILSVLVIIAAIVLIISVFSM